MKDYAEIGLLEVISASGSHIELKNGQKLIDAISSWWCKSLGHGHPRLKQTLKNQLEKFEHVIQAGTTNETIVALSEKLANLSPGLNKVFYAGDGSCAVEIAMKMSLHSRILQGDKTRTQFLALSNGYHGETIGALSVSDLGLYRDPYASLLFPCHFIEGLPYLHDDSDPLWHNCEPYWDNIAAQLEPYADTATAILIEPIVQGAGGMRIYSQDFLRRLRKFTAERGIHIIADEIMTGLGRTGKMLACEHAQIEPDFICLSKGLTSGFMPFSAVLITQSIYDQFYADYEMGKSFLHSHTYSGNALAASVALEVIRILTEEKLIQKAKEMSMMMRNMLADIAERTGFITNVRGVGAIAAADLVCDPDRRAGFEMYQQAIARGALLRPLGNTIYWLPPLTIEDDTLNTLKMITEDAITTLFS
jgi:adenosylmethionine-8-amino-7-oxononanoate aminotransferase